jgi:outer membrane protein assembly factor BamB
MKIIFFFFAFSVIAFGCNPMPTPAPVVDASIPKLVWKSIISNELTGSICPIVHGDYALFSRSVLSADTEPLIAFDKNTGKKLWEWNDYKRKGDLRGYKNTYYAFDNVAVITQGSQVYAIDLKMGKTLWENKVGDAALENVTGIGSTIFQEKFKNVNGSDLPYLAKCDIRTGQWQTIFTDSLMLNFTQYYNISEPMIDTNGDTLLIFSNTAYRLPGNPGGEASMSFIYSFNVTQNKLNYKKTIFPNKGINDASNEILNGRRYVYGDYSISCYDTKTGEQLWQKKNLFDVIKLVADNKIFTISDKGIIKCIDVNTQAELWNLSLDGVNTLSNFEYANGILYFSSGWLYAIDATTGKQLWHYADTKNGEARGGFILKLNVDKATKRIYIGNNLEALCYETIK